MIVERSLDPGFLSNSYLLADGPGGHGVLIDAGAPPEPLLAAVERARLTVTHVLVTHRHGDHLAHLGEYRRRFDVPVLAHPLEADHVSGAVETMGDGDTITSGDLQIRAIHTPGHTAGMLAFVVGDDEECFTGDTLFQGTVGGVRAPGSTSFEDLRSSIMDRLLVLPEHCILHPGHVWHTTVGRERDHNPFIRIWRGLDPEGSRPCTALGEPATLILWADDHDGGHKAWVRWADGRDDIVPGSRVQPG
jgi:glyoxylase-like metal-dependent hydrolase (beta-lactamase superfamily II)